MKNPKIKVGDKVRMLNKDEYNKFDVGEILTVKKIDSHFDDNSFTGSSSSRYAIYVDGSVDTFELYAQISDTTLETVSNIIDESAWYGTPAPYPKSKPTQALGALIKVLVDKGLVTEDDFRNALLSNNNDVGEPVLADAQPSNKND